MKYTTELFLSKAQTVHGDRFQYNRTQYKSSRDKVIVTCLIHGDFEIEPASHLRGTGCRKCQYSTPSVRKYTEEEILEKFKSSHGDRYDYRKFKYVGAKTPSTIVCREHGEFEQRPQNHIDGNGCPRCGQGKGGRPKNTKTETLNTTKLIVKAESEYLTEQTLKKELNSIFPDSDFIHDKVVGGAQGRFRPDFRCEKLKLIIEFNGYGHYTSSNTIYNDLKKKDIYTKLGYKIVEIPYFVQLTPETVEYYFNNLMYNRESDVHTRTNHYPHGFISKKSVLPIDFSRLGYERYKDELSRLPENIQKSIHKSLDLKELELGRPVS